MSKVSTYVKGSDGNWYENPTLAGLWDEELAWTILFDDDDPIEFVIFDPTVSALKRSRKSTKGSWRFYLSKTQEILEAIGIQYRSIRQAGACHRIPCNQKAFRFSYSFFLSGVSTLMPVPFIVKHWGRYKTTPEKEGVYYNFDLTSRVFFR